MGAVIPGEVEWRGREAFRKLGRVRNGRSRAWFWVFHLLSYQRCEPVLCVDRCSPGGPGTVRLGRFLAYFLGHTPSFRRFPTLSIRSTAADAEGESVKPPPLCMTADRGFGYKEFDELSAPHSVRVGTRSRITRNTPNRGLAEGPSQERSSGSGARTDKGESSGPSGH